jgi:hypothetical protein
MPYPVPCTGVVPATDGHTDLALGTREVSAKQKRNRKKLGTYLSSFLDTALYISCTTGMLASASVRRTLLMTNW